MALTSRHSRLWIGVKSIRLPVSGVVNAVSETADASNAEFTFFLKNLH